MSEGIVEEGPTEEELRAAIFIPCDTKEHLHQWIKVFLGLDMPDCIVDKESNCSPMDMIWEVYSKALRNDDDDFDRVLYYASRDGGKTLAAAIIELLALFHLDRNVAHMAAIEAQSHKCQQYVRNFLSKPILREFVVGDNKEMIWVVRYLHKETGDNIPESIYSKLMESEKNRYLEKRYYLKIIIATMAGSNSEHVPLFCVDGSTLIQGKNLEKEGSNRKRKAYKANGLFKRLKGLNPGGRPAPGVAEVIECPDSKIELISLNVSTGSFEFKPVVRAQRSFRPTIIIKTILGKILICTADEPLLVQGRGFIQAGELLVGDILGTIGKAKSDRAELNERNKKEYIAPIINDSREDQWHQVLLGSLLGDCGIYKKPMNNPYIQEQHCMEQAEYMKWKMEILSEKLRTVIRKNCRSGYTGEEQVGFRSGNSPLLLPYLNLRKDLEGVESLGPMGLAVWYMDDGCKTNGFRLSTECFTFEQNEKLRDVLFTNFGIKVNVRSDKEYFYLRGGVDAKRRLSEICAPFIHKDLAYKFDVNINQRNCSICSRIFWPYIEGAKNILTCSNALCRMFANPKGGLIADKILSIEASGDKWVYDFTLEGNHNFVANGIIAHNCIDEIDVVANPKAYQEAQQIPAPFEGKMPITILTSTRKFNYGLVQKEIDKADKTGLKIRHWNAIDVTARCPPDRHLPEEPKIPVYVSDSKLEVIEEAAFKNKTDDEKEAYIKHEAYAGCLRNCSLFASCKGRLATEQKSDSKLLKPIKHTINNFRKTEHDMAQAQLLCRKPSSIGLIYPRFSKDTHLITAAEMAEKITGSKFDPFLTKEGLHLVIKQWGLKWFSGMDFGYSHNFAVVTGAVDGVRIYITDVISEPGLEPDQMVDICTKRIKKLRPRIYPDKEDPRSIAVLKKHGFRMQDWTKGPGSVIGGINAVRLKLKPVHGIPQLFILKNDDYCELLADRIGKYHFKTDAAGNVSDVPDDEDDDECDGLRYLIMNVFGFTAKISIAPEENDRSVQAAQTDNFDPVKAAWSEIMQEHGVDMNSNATPVKKSGGSIKFDMS